MANKVKLKTLVEKMNLKNLTPDVDLSEKEVEIPDINRPALQLTGFFEHFDPKYADQDEFSLLKVLEETSGREMPQAIKDILNANILHDLECDADKMKDTVKNILEV